MSNLLDHLIALFGDDTEVITDSNKLSYYLRGTEGFEFFEGKKRQIIAIIKVTKKSEVKLLLDLANGKEFEFCVYPISTGKNWGYGTSQPAEVNNNTIILDLSLLTNIYIDQELGLVTLEPGVTQQHLSEFLIELGDKYMVPVTGAGPECSIIGNAIERGYGITPYTDHFGAVTAIRGYWGSGRSYQSALYELDLSESKMADKTFKWGVGPYVDGLFTQSNLGVVTEMTIRLAARKPAFASFFIQLNSDDLLETAIPIIRQVLRDYEGIVGSINLMDKRRLLSMFAQNPQTENNHQVMSQLNIDNLAKQLDTPSWTIVGSIYATKQIVKCTKKEIKLLFGAVPNKLIFSDSLIIEIGNCVIKYVPKLAFNYFYKLNLIKRQLESFDLGKEIMLGKPNRVALSLAYWRHKDANKFENKLKSPALDNCGLLWYAPLIVMKPKIIREFVEFIRSTCPKYNIEPFITFTNLRHDCVDSTIPIVFDLADPAAVKDAHNCLDMLVSEGLKRGYVPYRLNIDQQQRLLDKNSDFWSCVSDIKQALDPNGILSPNRYNPR